MLPSYCGGTQSSCRFRRIFQKIEDPDAIASREDDTFMPRHNPLRDRQRGAHDEAREIHAFVSRSRGEKAFLLARSAQLDTIGTGCQRSRPERSLPLKIAYVRCTGKGENGPAQSHLRFLSARLGSVRKAAPVRLKTYTNPPVNFVFSSTKHSLLPKGSWQ